MEQFMIIFTYVLCHLRNLGIAFVPVYLWLRRRHSDRVSPRICSAFFLGVLGLAYVQIFLLHKVDEWRDNFTARSLTECNGFNASQGYLSRLDVPVFYISSEGSSGRRQNLEHALSLRGLKGVHVQAVSPSDIVSDSETVLDGQKGRVYGLSSSLPNAVLLSHLLAARRLWLSDAQWGIIVEDDANLDLECLWEEDELGKMIDTLSPQWQAVHLYTGLYLSEPTLKFRRARMQGTRALRFGELGGKNNYYWGAVAYALHRRGAEKLLTLFAPATLEPSHHLVIDFRSHRPMVSEQMLRVLPYLYHSTRPLVAHGPFLPTHQSFTSLIHTSHSDFHQMSNDIMLRFFYDDRNPVSYSTVFAFLKLLPGYSWANTMTIISFFFCGFRIMHIIYKLKPGPDKRAPTLAVIFVLFLSLFLQTLFLEPL